MRKITAILKNCFVQQTRGAKAGTGSLWLVAVYR